MPRTARVTHPGMPLHIIQRGNNRQACFNCEEDLSIYAHWLKQYASKYHVDIHAWVFMRNHVHFLLTPNLNNSASKLMQSLGRMYVRYFNNKYDRSGTLWEGRFKSCSIKNTAYLLECYRYIELNPVNANIVLHPAEYKWSSYRSNAFGKSSTLCTPHDEYLQLGRSAQERQERYQRFVDARTEPQIIEKIKTATRLGLVL